MSYRLGSCLPPSVVPLSLISYFSPLYELLIPPNPYSYSTSTPSHYHTSIWGFSLPDYTVRISLISFASNSAPSHPEDSPILANRLPDQHLCNISKPMDITDLTHASSVSLLYQSDSTDTPDATSSFDKVSLGGFPDIRL